MNPQHLSLHIHGHEIISDQESTYEIAKMQLKTEQTLEAEDDSVFEYETPEGSLHATVQWCSASLERFLNEAGDDFCWDLDVLYDDKSIGTISFNRLFVQDLDSIFIYLDNEAPNSLALATYLQHHAFEDVEGRYIGLIDELVLPQSYHELTEWVASLLLAFLYEANDVLKLFNLYTFPKSSVARQHFKDMISSTLMAHYQAHGFELVDAKHVLLEWNIWRTVPSRAVLTDDYLKVLFG